MAPVNCDRTPTRNKGLELSNTKKKNIFISNVICFLDAETSRSWHGPWYRRRSSALDKGDELAIEMVSVSVML